MGSDEKRKVLGQRLDADELEQVSGGTHKEASNECPNCGNVGGCEGAFYVEACRSSVHAGSVCSSNDFNYLSYTPTQGAWNKYDDLGNQCLLFPAQP